jgi:phage major head subunit gpT-like protein
MATMTEGNLNYLLDEVVTAVAMDSAFEGEAVTPMLYAMRAATGRRERVASFAGLDVFSAKQETVAPAEDEVVQQFEKTLVPTAFAKLVKFSRELAEDEEWGFISKLADNIGASFQQTIETNGAAPFIDAFAGATYKAEDELSICNTAHLNKDGGNSQGNYGTNALGMDGVKASRTAMRKITDYRGKFKSKLKPDMLVVPVDLEETAWEIVRSLGRPDSANRAENMYNGMFSMVAWDELTDTNDWFMIDSQKMRARQNLLWLWRTPFEIASSGDWASGVRQVGGYFRSVHGVIDWRWIYGNSP